jgi:hypothetical protein
VEKKKRKKKPKHDYKGNETAAEKVNYFKIKT